MTYRLLDLFCGRWGWSRAFAKRGWKCLGIDLVEPLEVPANCIFSPNDILDWTEETVKDGQFDFIVASPPCEQFSVHGMKHFHKNPPYPELGIRLFNHARQLCEASGVPYVMENVRAAQQFVGRAVHHCGPFYLWGNGVPPLLNMGIIKGYSMKREANNRRSRRKDCPDNPYAVAARMATIPPELANCVADYAERILEQRDTRTNIAANPSA